MTTTADVTIPVRTIPPGPALADTATTIEIVRRISLDDGPVQYFRVLDSADLDAFETAVDADHRVASFRAIERTATHPLYRIEWAGLPPCSALYRDDLLIERMSGSPAGWAFRVRAGDYEALGALQRDCRDAGIHLEIGRVDRAADDPSSDPYDLTPKQREVLVLAIEEGYFSVPRETSLVDLAAILGVSDQAVSECLRRAQRNLVRATLLADGEHVASSGASRARQAP